MTLTAVKAGTATVTFQYARNWEEGNAQVIAIEFTVADDMSVTYTEVK